MPIKNIKSPFCFYFLLNILLINLFTLKHCENIQIGQYPKQNGLIITTNEVSSSTEDNKVIDQRVEWKRN